ncbi:MAG: pyridoxal phosphate-dependent aminotransferase [Nitriliruptorales bacterium]
MGEGTVASAAAVGPPPGMAVRLSSNESPFGPSPAAIDAMQTLAADAHLYPDDQSVALRDALARLESVPVERIVVGTGSAGNLMDLIEHECINGAGPGEVLTFDRAFIVYKLAAQAVLARLVEAPLGENCHRDPDALLERVTDDTRVVAIDNPANPTGDHLSGEELRHLITALPEHVTIVVDEAYHQFAVGQRGYATVAELGLDHPRLCVVRTFSKAYALAGLRVGYLTGPPDLVAAVDTDRVRFNANAMAHAAAVAALGDSAHLERTVTGTLEGRARMADGLRELGVPFVDGLGNFLQIELGEPSGPIVEAYAGHGVGVRPLAPYRLGEQIRVSVGTPEEVDVFLEASAKILADVASRTRRFSR